MDVGLLHEGDDVADRKIEFPLHRVAAPLGTALAARRLLSSCVTIVAFSAPGHRHSGFRVLTNQKGKPMAMPSPERPNDPRRISDSNSSSGFARALIPLSVAIAVLLAVAFAMSTTSTDQAVNQAPTSVQSTDAVPAPSGDAATGASTGESGAAPAAPEAQPAPPSADAPAATPPPAPEKQDAPAQP